MNEPNKVSLRLSFDEIYSTLNQILLSRQFSIDDAALSSRLFTETTQDGVYSHGLNRFPRYLHDVEMGYIIPINKPTKIEAFGQFEIWNGNQAPGNTTAYKIMQRCIDLASNNVLGIIALRNTNHWLRAGSYGWQAANQGCAAICFTNTEPNMPAWGAASPLLGNNPLVIAVPDKNPMVLDMAMSQFSFGKLELLVQDEKKLPMQGGFDMRNQLTNDPAEIIKSKKALPIGYWKGSGLSMMLDMMASILSGGKSTADIGKQSGEYGVSQFFMAINLKKTNQSEHATRIISELKSNLSEASPMDKNSTIRYPGQQVLRIREENKQKGIPVPESLWETINNLK